MATMTYPSLTSRQTRQSSSSSGPLATTNSQNSPYPAPSTPSQGQTMNAQLSTTQNSNTQVFQSPARSFNHHVAPSSQPANRPNSQPNTPNKSMPPMQESPGAWKHPRAEEIARRQRASTFGPDNISMLVKTFVVGGTVWLAQNFLPNFVWTLLSPISGTIGNALYMAYVVAMLSAIVIALKPWFYGQDQLLDIDLNATQRSLLGLDPNATPPATPATKYVTPPKYTRSATPRTGTPGSRGSSPGGSPLAYKDTSGYARSGNSITRRSSLGSDPRKQSFGLSASIFGTPSKEGSMFVPQTPSPVARASGIPFSNKWLYHKATSNAMSREAF